MAVMFGVRGRKLVHDDDAHATAPLFVFLYYYYTGILEFVLRFAGVSENAKYLLPLRFLETIIDLVKNEEATFPRFHSG
jgi:hypothetical protein